MKRIFTSALALLLLAGAVQAQDNSAKRKQMQVKHQDGMKALNLSADQQAKIKAIHEQEKAEAESLKNAKLTIDEHKAKRKELQEKYQSQIKAVLTAEQQQKMEAMRNRKGDRGERNGQMENRKLDEKDRRANHEMKRAEDGRDTIRAHSRLDEKSMNGRREKEAKDMAAELNLSADQKAKAKEIRQNYKTRLDQVKNDNSLSQDQKKAKFQELMKAQQEEMKSILTKDQVEKMNSMRKQRGAKK